MKSKPQYIYDRSKLPEYLTIVEAANFIGMSEKTITRYCHNGEIPHFKLERAIRIPRQAFFDFIDSKTQHNKKATVKTVA